MNAQLKTILITMLVDFTRKDVLEKEIIFGGKKGIQKLEAVEKDFWKRAKEFMKKAQERNNPYIPDSIEFPAEEMITARIDVLEKEIKIRDLIERILGEEKRAIDI